MLKTGPSSSLAEGTGKNFLLPFLENKNKRASSLISIFGGRDRIRTCEAINLLVFKTSAINHSATLPFDLFYHKSTMKATRDNLKRDGENGEGARLSHRQYQGHFDIFGGFWTSFGNLCSH